MPKEQIQKSITLGDGTLLENSYCGFTDRHLWCFVTGKTVAECARIFSDPLKTSEITSYYYIKGYIYKGFTELLTIEKNSTTVDVRLTWPEGQPHSVEEIEDIEETEE